MTSDQATAQKPVLSICIVNFNTRDDLDRCLASIFERHWQMTLEVLVVDNASTDGSAEMVGQKYPNVRLIKNQSNVGFAAANNQAIKESRGDFCLLLNPDTIVLDGAFDAMVDFMQRHPQAGAAGCKLLNRDGSVQYSCRSFPDLGAGLFRNTPLGRFFPKNPFTRRYLMSDFDHNRIREVDWLSGACLMVRREAIEQVGLMDEGYYMYCEDVDWCYRMHRAGWKVYFVPTGEVIHLVGRSSDQRMISCIVQFHKSMLRFYLKNYRWRYPLVLFPLIAIGIALRCLGAVSKVWLHHLRLRWRKLLNHVRKRAP